jgi:hypothetical protein
VSSKADQLNLTPGQATYVLTRLVDEGRITAKEITKLAGEMEAEIAQLEARLAKLQGALARGSAPGRAGGKRLSAKGSASRRIQGEYMGLIRHLAAKDRGRIKKIAAERGREAAIREMRSQAR